MLSIGKSAIHASKDLETFYRPMMSSLKTFIIALSAFIACNTVNTTLVYVQNKWSRQDIFF